MTGGVSAEVEDVGVVPAARVAVGGSEDHQDLPSLRDGDIADLDVSRGCAEEVLDSSQVMPIELTALTEPGESGARYSLITFAR